MASLVIPDQLESWEWHFPEVPELVRGCLEPQADSWAFRSGEQPALHLPQPKASNRGDSSPLSSFVCTRHYPESSHWGYSQEVMGHFCTENFPELEEEKLIQILATKISI